MGAMGRLLKNPEATEEVFIIIQALAGDSVERGYARFKSTPQAGAILAQERALIDVLADRNYLRQLPDGSLGRAYLKFMEEGNITADGLKAASEVNQEERFADPALETYALRLRDQHDLWHTVSGFGRDVAGEACLLAFTYAQTQNRGLGFIALMGGLKLRKAYGVAIFKSMWQAYQMGRRARWLPGQWWEQKLSQPLAQVQQELAITAPDRYENLPRSLAAAS
jgi:ubiquinone biosynthesis protein COQ4